MTWKQRIAAAFAARGVPEDDVLEELALHAAAMYAAARADGSSADDAARLVDDQIAIWVRDRALYRRRVQRAPAIEPPPATSSRWIGVSHDVRYALRLLRRRPGPGLLAVVTMALGIGATTVLFSLTWGVLMRPLPWSEADRIVRLQETRQGSTRPLPSIITNATYLAWREAPSTIEELAGWSARTVTLTGAGDPQRIRIVAATASMFPLLRARPAIGSAFDAAAEAASREVAVLSHGLWQQRFGGLPDVLGRPVYFDSRPYTIIGVMPAHFAFPDSEARAWVPFRVRPVLGDQPSSRYISLFSAMARLRHGVTAAQAGEEATARARNAPDQGLAAIAVFGSRGPATISAVPVLDAMTADVRSALLVLLAAVALLLATATANIASVQLARATTRRREMALRGALGAGSGRLARQLLVENVVLGAIGGAAGLLLAFWLHRALPSLLPADFPRVDAVTLDARVMVFAIAVSLAVSVAFGLLPALQTRRLNLVAALADDGAGGPAGYARSHTARARTVIMAAQVAIACVLLVGASLLIRSFQAMMNVDRGYDVVNVLTARAALPDASFTSARRAQFATAVLERLQLRPDVTAAGLTTVLPLGSADMLMGFRMPRRRGGGEEQMQVQAALRIVSADYFTVLGIRLVEGRTFTPADTPTSLPVVVVNRTFVKRYLDGPPLGTKLPAGFDSARSEWEIAGVIEDVLPRGVSDPAQPEIFVSYRQLSQGLDSDPMFVVRTRSDPAALAGTLRAIVRDEDASVALDSIMTMEQRLTGSLARPRLYAIVLGGFAVFAVVIAAVGLFGVLSYSVAQRAREIGVRTTLGARPRDIVRLVVKEGLVVTAAGLVAGIGCALAFTSSLSTFLYGVAPHDALTFVAVPLVLVGVASAACFVPARRAARLDPLQVLKQG